MATITQQQLENHLWSAADILRGSIDSSDYKNYIFGFLFLKRLSDVFEEEAERIQERELSGGADPEEANRIAYEDPDEHQFFVPPRARWSEITKLTTHIGDGLNKAAQELEDCNGTKLEGVLAGTDFADPRKLGDIKSQDLILERLVRHFSEISLRNGDLSEPDLLGRAYEYLIERFADDAGKKGGEFYTPHRVVQLIVDLLAPQERMRICDPTCGSGGMLIECARYVRERGGDSRNISLFGQEKNLGTWAICKMNMVLHGLPDARIEKGDVIRDPKLLEGGEVMLFDRVIANPPFSLDEWGVEKALSDPHGRFRFGVPPKTKGDLAFVQHMLSTTNAKGMVGVVMPHGVLFRGGSEGRIRKAFLEEDLLEAVIGLAPNLFYGTGIPAAILIFHRSKEESRKQKVFFIHAGKEYEAAKNQNRLLPQNIEKIVNAFVEFSDQPKFARVVDLSEIRENDYNLNISRYVDITEEEEKLDVRDELRKLRELERERDQAEKEMNAFLKELGYE